MEDKLAQKAREWLGLELGDSFLSEGEYCSSRDIFQARLDKMRTVFESAANEEMDLIYLLIAVIGEIGNNSFDHNLGQWRDIGGIFFNFDQSEKIVVLADRGQGFYSSMKKAISDIPNDLEAIKIAFTKQISGRQPERRGNGLKFVANIAQQTNIEVFLQSG
ncbi:MAG: hypothetical protein CEN88_32, partial [Candidatus Berkelbacteria bacterium Licking1014_2]